MTKYSRTQKYEELRNHLQNDSESDIKSRDLSGYEKRLNHINSDNFEEPEDYQAEDHDPIHARRRQYLDHPEEEEAAQPKADESSSLSQKENENYTNTFDDSYLNDYINEVKQYNIDQGNALTGNTDLNILKSLRGERPAPKKPYPNEVDEEEESKPQPQAPRLSEAQKHPEPTVHPLGSKPAGSADSTIDIPFVRGADINPSNDFVDPERTANPEQTRSQSMTREDIANEVQNLIRQQDPARPASSRTPDPQDTYSDQYPTANDTTAHLEAERATRQQLLNETTQMRAQLDDYEENLSDVSDKMKHTNKVLNFVLIILIIAMVVVLLVVIYWILSSKGIL